MKVSVALATCNGSIYVREQVLSILNQSHPVDEIVVSDDASGDDTLSVIEETIRQWSTGRKSTPALTVLRNARPLGVTSNFEQALSECTGDVIALCDQDDRWHTSKIAKILERFASRPDLELVHTDARIVDAHGLPTALNLLDTLNVTDKELDEIRRGDAFAALLRRNLVTGATAVIRAELLARARPFPSSWVHDEWLAIVAAAEGQLALLESPLIDYRQHGSNEIGATRTTIAIRFERLKQPRSERNARLLKRAQALVDRLATQNVSASVLANAQSKFRHEQVRSSLPRRRLLRVAPIAREWASGRYRQYGLGIQDVLRDLVQPA